MESEVEVVPRIQVSIHNLALRQTLVHLLKGAGYAIALPGEAAPIVLTTESETSVEACATLAGSGVKVVVLMTSTSTRAHDAFVAAGACCADIGAPMSRVLALISDAMVPATYPRAQGF